MDEQQPSNGRKYLGVSIIASVAVLILFSFGGFSLWKKANSMNAIAHFQNAGGLRVGAPVRFAGVDVGVVKSVRVRPEMREKPVEVVMSLRTGYDLKVPSDAVVTLETAGVLGETFPDIDVRTATGPPLKSGGELMTRESPQMSAAEMIEKFGAALDRNCESAVKALEERVAQSQRQSGR